MLPFMQLTSATEMLRCKLPHTKSSAKGKTFVEIEPRLVDTIAAYITSANYVDKK